MQTFVINNQSQAFCFGRNVNGELGLRDFQDRWSPTLFPLSGISDISLGGVHTLMISNSILYSFGTNYFSQLGFEDNIDRKIPTMIPNFYIYKFNLISAGFSHSVVLTKDLLLFAFGEENSIGINTFNPILNINLYPFNVAKVSAGYVHSLILTNSSQVYSFGFNYVSLKLLI